MAGKIPSQFIVPWDKSDALSQLCRAVISEDGKGQIQPMETMWNALPYSGASLRIDYHEKGLKPVDLIMPSTRTEWEFETTQALVNLVCGLYAYVSIMFEQELPDDPGHDDSDDTDTRSTKVESLFKIVQQERAGVEQVMPDDVLAGFVKALSDIKTMSSTSDRTIESLNIVCDNVTELQGSVMYHHDGVQQVCEELLECIDILSVNCQKLQKLAVQSPAYGDSVSQASRDFMNKWAREVTGSISSETFTVLTSWQACWDLISTNYDALGQYSADAPVENVDYNAEHMVLSSEDWKTFSLAAADSGLWLDKFDQTMAIMDQFRVDNRGRTNPIHEVLGKDMRKVERYGIPESIEVL